jgi:replicative DNA helicase
MHVAQRAAQAFPHLSLVDATRGQASSAKLLETARSVRAESEHFLIVLDSVHAWADGLNADLSEYDRINRTLTDLRLLASELDCPILAVAERNRSSMGTGGLSAGAGSRKIEYGAETVFDLTRDDGQVGVTGELPVSVTLAKNRNGSPGAKVSLLFNGGLQRFREA